MMDARSKVGPRERGRPRRRPSAQRERWSFAPALLAGAPRVSASRSPSTRRSSSSSPTMATKVEAGAPASRSRAARIERTPASAPTLEAGRWRKLFASEGRQGGRGRTRSASTAATATARNTRSSGLYRDAPLLLIGGGPRAEIQRMVIGRTLLPAQQDLAESPGSRRTFTCGSRATHRSRPVGATSRSLDTRGSRHARLSPPGRRPAQLAAPPANAMEVFAESTSPGLCRGPLAPDRRRGSLSAVGPALMRHRPTRVVHGSTPRPMV